jgi:hypothetical protein
MLCEHPFQGVRIASFESSWYARDLNQEWFSESEFQNQKTWKLQFIC